MSSSSYLDLAFDAVRARPGGREWRVQPGSPWCRVTPAGGVVRSQGWKLHLAATPASAPEILKRALPHLLDAGCTFKFAATPGDVIRLNDAHCPRHASGKFVTVYPDGDDQLRRLAARLHAATTGLQAPAILSDRPYRPGSAVHYRYGAFAGGMTIDNDGRVLWTVERPDGRREEDRREPRFSAPAWAVPPFPEQIAATPRRTGDEPLVLGDRYRVAAAVRHANKGGVYRALDLRTGDEVIVKEARPHVGIGPHGHDARDVLRAEARMLDRAAALGLAPRRLDHFEQAGHAFLVQERVPGTTLRQWALRQLTPDDCVPAARAYDVGVRLAGAVDALHRAGLVLRDLSPNNVMVGDDHRVWIIDLELAVDVAAPPDPDPNEARGTLGYAAPELFASARPAPAFDCFSLGAVLAYLFTARDPFGVPDRGAGARSPEQRLGEWLGAEPHRAAVPEPVRALLLALCQEDPARRPTAGRVRALLAGMQASPAGTRTARWTSPSPRPLTDDRRRAMVAGCLDQTLDMFDPSAPDRPWPTSPGGAAIDPCGVQHGAAGVLMVLTQAWRVLGDPRLPDVIAAAAGWLEGALDRGPERRVPGLHFGASGIAWALCDAGVALGEPRLTERACAILDGLDPAWPSPDVSHGRAGLGLALLHVADAVDAPALRTRAHGCADSLIATATRRPDGSLAWAAPAGFDSALAGTAFHGFAHGTAGVGHFLLELGRITGRADCLELAREAGESLLAGRVEDDMGARWTSGPDTRDAPVPHWCRGSSGVGTFLVRLSLATGDERFLRTAEAAGRAVVATRWQAGLAYCHGLPGNADFLLDLARLGGLERFAVWAEDLAAILWSRRVLRDGRVVFANAPTPAGSIGPDFNAGLGGILAFLLRLGHDVPRALLVDHVAAEPVR